MFFDSFLQLGSLASLATAFSFPPGYKAAFQSNLAVWIAPFFKNADVPARIARLAERTFKAIKRTNRRTPQAVLDTYLISRPQPTYNVFTDSRGA
jgi:hypothetical protein